MAIDRRERAGDMGTALLAYGEGLQAGIWTALPGIIQSFDPATKTCVVQPAVQARVLNADGSEEWVALPLLLDCPVQFAGGGGCTLTFPLKLGDECLVVFSSRCIDSWWQLGGVQVQAELRMHDLSDGFCVPGISSVPKVQPNIDTTSAQLRTDDGAAKVTVNPVAKSVQVATTGSGAVAVTTSGTGAVNVSTTGSGAININSVSQVNITGAQINITGSLKINNQLYQAHRHTDPQGGQTSGVV